MAYLVKNVSLIDVVLREGIVVRPGTERPFTEIGTRELDLQRAGVITISRPNSPDDFKDDARYVELINPSGTATPVEVLRPDKVGVFNVTAALKNTWYLVSLRIADIMGWKLQLRRQKKAVAFDYQYAQAPEFMTCIAGETVFADADFPELYVRVPDKDAQIIEFEYWTK